MSNFKKLEIKDDKISAILDGKSFFRLSSFYNDLLYKIKNENAI